MKTGEKVIIVLINLVICLYFFAITIMLVSGLLLAYDTSSLATLGDIKTEYTAVQVVGSFIYVIAEMSLVGFIVGGTFFPIASKHWRRRI